MTLRLAALVLILAVPAQAEARSPVKTAELSARLCAAGLEMGDPLLILSAAKQRKTLGLKPSGLLAIGAVADAKNRWVGKKGLAPLHNWPQAMMPCRA